MRDGASSPVLASAASWQVQVSSWLGGVLLEDSVPVVSGRVRWDASQQVPERLTLTVPRRSVEDGRTVDWLPSKPDSALGSFGQQLDVSLIVDGVVSRLGRFQIDDWSEQDGGSISVTGLGMLQAAADDRLQQATSPRTGGTLKSEFARLLPPFMQAQFDVSLTDRACPAGFTWDEDRLAALYDIADAWPARLRTDTWGNVQVLPPLPERDEPVLTLTDGEGGTVISAPSADTREGRYNMVVARSSADGVTASGVAKVESGPLDPDGEYHPVPMFYSSPLLLTDAQCVAAARTKLASVLRPTMIRKVSMAPDPRVELDDCVELRVGGHSVPPYSPWRSGQSGVAVLDGGVWYAEFGD